MGKSSLSKSKCSGAEMPVSKCQLCNFTLGLGLGVLSCLLIWWLQTPTYLELTIPVKPNATGYFWWERQRSSLSYADESGGLYILRKEGTGYAEQQDWLTEEAAMMHFDT